MRAVIMCIITGSQNIYFTKMPPGKWGHEKLLYFYFMSFDIPSSYVEAY